MLREVVNLQVLLTAWFCSQHGYDTWKTSREVVDSNATFVQIHFFQLSKLIKLDEEFWKILKYVGDGLSLQVVLYFGNSWREDQRKWSELMTC